MVDTNGDQKKQNPSDSLTVPHVFKKHLDILMQSSSLHYLSCVMHRMSCQHAGPHITYTIYHLGSRTNTVIETNDMTTRIIAPRNVLLMQ